MSLHAPYAAGLAAVIAAVYPAQSATLSGHVLDQNGEPIAKAAVVWRSVSNIPMVGTGVPTSVPSAPTVGSVVSDANGQFQIQGLSSGNYRLCVTSLAQPSHLSTCEWRDQEVALSISDVAAPVALVVQNGAVLRFHVSDLKGRLTSANLSIIVSAANGGFAHARITTITPTDAVLSVSVPFDSKVAAVFNAPGPLRDSAGAPIPLTLPTMEMAILAELVQDIWLTAE